MTLSSHRKHKIYLAATMGYGIGSDDQEEMAYYDKIIKEMKNHRKNMNLGIQRSD